MIVCHCHVVNDAPSRRPSTAARTLGQVCRSTGAGSDCGSCVFSVRRLVCEHVSRQVPESVEAQHAAS